MDSDKLKALNELYQSQEKIESILAEIESTLKIYFPNEYETAYQHWIPQIKTALSNKTKWLPRGQYSMDYTIDRILDSLNNNCAKGVNKYIN